MSFQRRLSLNLSAEQKQKFYFSSIYFSQLYIAFHGKRCRQQIMHGTSLEPKTEGKGLIWIFCFEDSRYIDFC